MMKIFSKMRFGALFAAALFFCLAAWRIEAAVDPVVVELHYQNGVKFYNRGLYKKAIREFEKTLSLDPRHEEARDYLDKAKAFRDAPRSAEPKPSRDEEIVNLYREGRALYRARDYEGAILVFDKILESKPVDDVASFYKERCERAISRKLAKEKKVKPLQASPKQTGQGRGEEALAAKQKKISEKEIRKIERIEATKEVREHKELFLRGVEAYGRKQYEAAIADFEALIDAESAGKKVFTNAARRLTEKAKTRLKKAQNE